MISRLAAIVVCGIVASAARRAAGQDTAEARRQVLAVDDRRADAIRRGDGAALREIYVDDFTLVTPLGTIRTKRDNVDDLRSGQLREQPRILERSVRVYGDVAILLSKERNDVVLGGQQVGGDMLLTRVFKKFDGDWKLIATQGTYIRP